ncbi:hypothetical protein N656DRAFT_779034 [Canariomyces notabilis]|uniref:Uncharacterized protein n=1 Tax=Canariomyces notabilis TaxID=2074819 RepID=A0AAN6TE81_9PEZI|nr:hypothetical protein N656DRAFT_779034 [Canariomyces arenarius]
MLRANIGKQGIRVCNGARPVTRPRRATNVRTAMYRKDSPDGTTSQLEWTPKTYAMIGGSILAVAGLYGLMMGKPGGVIRTEKSPVSTTEKDAKKVPEKP